jgi:hypothetical protein
MLHGTRPAVHGEVSWLLVKNEADNGGGLVFDLLRSAGKWLPLGIGLSVSVCSAILNGGRGYYSWSSEQTMAVVVTDSALILISLVAVLMVVAIWSLQRAPVARQDLSMLANLFANLTIGISVVLMAMVYILLGHSISLFPLLWWGTTSYLATALVLSWVSIYHLINSRVE